jgi:hypothetical protein
MTKSLEKLRNIQQKKEVVDATKRYEMINLKKDTKKIQKVT